MKFKANHKYTLISLYVVVVFAVCLLPVSFVFNFDTYKGTFLKIFSVLAPVTWGFIIAYILNPLMKFIEKYISKITNKKKKRRNLTRAIATTITMLITVALLTGLIVMVVPELIGSIEKIFDNIASYFNTVQAFTEKTLDHYPKIYDFIDGEFETIKKYVVDTITSLQPQFETLLNNVKDGAFSFLIGLKDFLLGMIVSVYLLYNKETLLAQVKKVLHAIMPERRCLSLLAVGNRTNTIFTNFISGKALDSLIIGMLTFICMSFLKMPYLVLISVIVAITNMIPFFGPFIGAIPSAFLILVESPKKAIIFIVMILIIQQFDGNILGPKILGDSLGLPTFWILFAIFLGGGLFGLFGMIIFVPLFAVFYTLLKEFIDLKLEKKKLPTNTEDYVLNDGFISTLTKSPDIISNESIEKENDVSKQKDNE